MQKPLTMHPIQLEPIQPAELLEHVVDAQLDSEVAPVHVGQLTPSEFDRLPFKFFIENIRLKSD
jgi:hypothetical protein